MTDKLYAAITDFAETYGSHKFNDPENHAAYMKIVNLCILEGKLHPANRKEFSTHGRITAAIAYLSDRERFCHS